jgi:hypothetical protein
MWKITDVYTGVNVMFNKQNQGTGGYLQLPESMGTFQPGEGKLYKLEPAG